ncbi:MAG: hypothetical protein WKG01_07880 [Kofleriaceae bacterium]
MNALPLAYRLAERADPETKRQLRRAALSINLNIVAPLENLLVRIVAMLTRMSGR